MDLLENACALQLDKVVVRRALGWKILGKLPPLAAGGKHIENGVDEGAATHTALWRQERLDQRILLVGKVALIAQALALVDRRARGHRIIRDSTDSRKIRAGSKNWFNNSGLNFFGFKFQTAVISVVLGSIFYVLAKVVFRFPAYWFYSIPLLVAALAAVAIIGFFVSGNVPKNKRSAYFRRFYIPTFGGLAVLFVSAMIDFLINVSVAVFSLLQTV
jgi:hypothetical protein